MGKKKFASMEEVMTTWKQYAGEKHRKELHWHLVQDDYALLSEGRVAGDRAKRIHAHLADCQYCCSLLAEHIRGKNRSSDSIILERKLAAEGLEGKTIESYVTTEGNYKLELIREPEKGTANIQFTVLNPGLKDEHNGKKVIIKNTDGCKVGEKRIRGGTAVLFHIPLDTIKDNLDSLIVDFEQ